MPGGQQGLAEIAGPRDLASDFERFLLLLTSPAVADLLSETPDLVPALFPDQWDAERQTWTAPRGPRGWLEQTLRRLAEHRRTWSPPDAEAVATRLADRLVVERQGITAIHRIAVRHEDPQAALAILARLTAAADDHLRAEAVRRLDAHIARLEDLAHALPAALAPALAQARLDNQRIRGMLSLSLPVAADPLGPPSVGALPDWPAPEVVLPLAAALGLFTGACAAAALPALRQAAR